MDSDRDDAVVRRLAARHGLSVEGVRAVLDALRSGGGSMAQFSHEDFGGMSQWSPGMAMVGDMFNSDLKGKLDAVATELSSHLRESPPAPARTPSDGAGRPSADWWPDGLGSPSAVGAQNGVRYAAFRASRRLVVEDERGTTIYDTGDHVISGVSQSQSTTRSLTFSSQRGAVRLDDLRVVEG